MHGQDQRAVPSYLPCLQQATFDPMRLGPDCVAVERKSLSLYQYCRYPANSLNRLNLWAKGSRDFRFCMRARQVLS